MNSAQMKVPFLFLLLLLLSLQAESIFAECVTCHKKASKGFSLYHEPKRVPCEKCHLGDSISKDKEEAHKNMEFRPGRAVTLPQTCGQSDCHKDITGHFHDNIMNTLSGMIHLTRKVFEEIPTGKTSFVKLHQLKTTGADSYLRKLCVSCHLGNDRKRKKHPIRNRGGGCSACHLKQSGMRNHPIINLKIGNEKCLGCHSRSSRISLNYMGLAEVDQKGDKSDYHYGYLPDKRMVERMPADIHYLAGMSCIDCHTVNEVMGTAKKAKTLKDQLDIQCLDCHAVKINTKKWSQLSRRDLIRRALSDLKPGAENPEVVAITQRKKTPLFHLSLGGKDRFQQLKLDGIKKKVPLISSQIYHSRKGHERLNCESCHSGWTPNCYGCHISYNPKGKQYDHLLKRKTPGRWKEYRWAIRNGLPAMGVTRDNRITPFVPGMNITIDKGGKSKKIETRVFASVSPHTTRKKSRSCNSCHQNNGALGIITEVIAHPKNPRWTTPIGWIDEDSFQPGKTLRKGSRSLNSEEISRIQLVGKCLNCHESNDLIFENFKVAKGNLTPACDLLSLPIK
ncbi:MAG: hypothetical protein GY786_17535 [Proteobacteria bacterium]|nr:hypothetical protein [Pseudomonadota bacterium]